MWNLRLACPLLLLALAGCLRSDVGLGDSDSMTTADAATVVDSSTETSPPDTTSSASASTTTGPDDSTTGPSETNTTQAPIPANCGDGVLDADEECDHGPKNSNNAACKLDCTVQVCGDGYLGPGELCDDGNDDNTDGCTNACKHATCGDGFVQAGEQCDDGNTSNNDECTNACKFNVCGDTHVHDGVEDCDDGWETVTCNTDCTTAVCGDGKLNPTAGEECDDGNQSNTDQCTNACTLPKCGDGFVQFGEACDDGNLIPGDGCDPTCKKEVIACQNLGVAISVAPSNRMVLCQRNNLCEKDYELICPVGWHMCSNKEFNNRNTGWNHFPAQNVFGGIRCRESGGAGQFGFKANMMNDQPDHCQYSSSRSACPTNAGCDFMGHYALCCAPSHLCGNGIVDGPDEECDDGNQVNTDACLNSCMATKNPDLPGCG